MFVYIYIKTKIPYICVQSKEKSKEENIKLYFRLLVGIKNFNKIKINDDKRLMN